MSHFAQVRVLFSCLVFFASGLSLVARPLTVGTVCWAGFSDLNVAEAKGFWAKQGLDVELVMYQSNQALNADLCYGRIDVALDMIGSWVGMQQAGVDLVILGEHDWSHGGDKIVAKRSFDPAALKGKSVGVYLNQPSVTVFLDRFLRTHQLSVSDVELVEMSPHGLADSFISGRLAIIVDYDPQASRAVQEGDGRVFATSATYPGIIPEGFAAMRDRWRQISAEDRLKFWRGVLRAMAWLRDESHWPEYQDILNRKTFPLDDDYTEAQLKVMLSGVSMHTLTKLDERNAPGGGLESYLDELHGFMKRTGQLRRPIDASSLLDTQSFLQVIRGSTP